MSIARNIFQTEMGPFATALGKSTGEAVGTGWGTTDTMQKDVHDKGMEERAEWLKAQEERRRTNIAEASGRVSTWANAISPIIRDKIAMHHANAVRLGSEGKEDEARREMAMGDTLYLNALQGVLDRPQYVHTPIDNPARNQAMGLGGRMYAGGAGMQAMAPAMNAVTGAPVGLGMAYQGQVMQDRGQQIMDAAPPQQWQSKPEPSIYQYGERMPWDEPDPNQRRGINYAPGTRWNNSNGQ